MMKAEKLNEEKLDCLNEAKKVIIIEDYEQQIKDMDFHFQYLIFSMPAAKSQTHQDFLPAKIKKKGKRRNMMNMKETPRWHTFHSCLVNIKSTLSHLKEI